MKAFENRVVVVTGGSRGIGREICKYMASEGANVVINYSSNREKAEELKDELIKEYNTSAIVVGFNVGVSAEVDTAFGEIHKEFSSIDVLVNNAGIAIDGLLMRTKEEDLQRIFQINVMGSFLCSKAASKSMMKQRYGRIVNISSIIGEMGNAGQSAYAASKSAIFGLTKSLARELGSRNITVNAVTPGYIQTDMTADMKNDQRDALLASVPLSRLGTVEDIAGAVGFLASEKASYITGQILGVNGGLYM